jgi:hypothetical protein
MSRSLIDLAYAGCPQLLQPGNQLIDAPGSLWTWMCKRFLPDFRSGLPGTAASDRGRCRRAVTSSMQLTAPGGRQPTIQAQWQPPIPTQWEPPAEPPQWREVQRYPSPRPGGLSAPVVTIPAGRPSRASDDEGTGWIVVSKRLRSLCYVYVAAGVAYGLVAATVWLEAGQMEFGARRLAIVAVLNAWPVVPTVLTVLAAGRRTTALVWGSYLLLGLLLSARSGIGLKAILTLILLMVVIPAVLLLALSLRNMRAVGPFLAVPYSSRPPDFGSGPGWRCRLCWPAQL